MSFTIHAACNDTILLFDCLKYQHVFYAGHRQNLVQAGRSGAALRAQDPRGHRAAADRRRLLRSRRRQGDHFQPGQGRRTGHHDFRDEARHRQYGRVSFICLFSISRIYLELMYLFLIHK